MMRSELENPHPTTSVRSLTIVISPESVVSLILNRYFLCKSGSTGVI